jgi:hypothetical protein
MSKISVLETTYDKIVAHCLEPDKNSLTLEQQRIFERWNAADDLLRRYPKEKQAMTMLRKKFPGLSRTQAYDDLRHAKKLFNYTNPVDKEFIRRWVIQDCLTMIDIARSMGPRGFKAWNTARFQLIRAARLEESENLVPNPEIFEQHQYFTVIQIGGQSVKIDLDDFNKLPLSTRKELSDLIHAPITEDQAVKILNS